MSCNYFRTCSCWSMDAITSLLKLRIHTKLLITHFTVVSHYGRLVFWSKKSVPCELLRANATHWLKCEAKNTVQNNCQTWHNMHTSTLMILRRRKSRAHTHPQRYTLMRRVARMVSGSVVVRVYRVRFEGSLQISNESTDKNTAPNTISPSICTVFGCLLCNSKWRKQLDDSLNFRGENGKLNKSNGSQLGNYLMITATSSHNKLISS